MPTHPTRCAPAALILLAGSAQALAGGTPFPAEIELSSLDGTNGFVLNGIDAGDQSGFSVSSAGDVNGDGLDDVIIGAVLADPNGQTRAGESYVVFGAGGVGAGGAIDLADLDGANGFVLGGIDAYDFSGASVSSAGDVNGDGFDDVIIGAYGADPDGRINSGESYVVFGGMGVGASGAIDLASLDGTTGFVLNGIDAEEWSGGSVSSAGDFNGDGIDDLIIGAYLAHQNDQARAGESYVVFGAGGVGASGAIDLASLDGTTGFLLCGIDYGDNSGRSVSSAGDVNSDEIDDVIIGAENADPNGQFNAGESYVVFGGAGVGASGAIDLASLDGTNGFVLNGIDAGDHSGSSVSSAGDVNGDGVDDLIIGARLADPNGQVLAGQSYVVFGGAAVGASGAIDLSSLDGTSGFALNGIDVSDWTGRSVSSAGDINGDGVDDLIIGAENAGPGGRNSAGESYVVLGGPGIGASGAIELSSLNGTTGFVLNGIDANDFSGESVSSAGDVNGDGVDDLIIGARDADPGGRGRAGESYVVFGRAPVPACAGDVNSDGATDVFDFALLAANFAAGPGATRAMGDVTGDGFVNVFDFSELAADFGCTD